MKAYLSGLAALLCCILFMGAAGLGAPVVPSKGFYVNDYADIIGRENRDAMLETARTLYENTGVQAVVLTVESFGEYSPEEYVKSVFDSWEIGGIEKNGVLILLCMEDTHILTETGINITAAYSMEIADKLAAEGKLSDAVSTYFFAVVDSIYSKYGAGENLPKSGSENTALPVKDESVTQSAHQPQDAKRKQITQSTAASQNANERFYLITIVLFLFIAFRGVRVSARYRKKYNKPYYRKHTPVANNYSRTVRSDDGDYPSGFGGLGNRKAIYGEDVDEAKDIGIVKHDYEDVFGEEDQGRE